MIALPIDKSIVKKEAVWCVVIELFSVKESKKKLSQGRWYRGYGQHSFLIPIHIHTISISMPCQHCAFLIAVAAVRVDVTCVWCGVGKARGVYCT
jgi:hypothetical protein